MCQEKKQLIITQNILLMHINSGRKYDVFFKNNDKVHSKIEI